MRVNRMIVCFCAAALLVLVGCSGPVAVQRAPLMVSWTIWPGYYPLAIAQQEGFFAKHGVSVKLIRYDAYTSAYTDYASGKLDGSEMVLGDLLLMLEKRDSKVVMVTDTSEGADQIVATNDIQSVAALKGKRIGVHRGTYGELFVEKMLEANGLSLHDVTLANINPEAVPDAFPSQIDAGHSFEPFTSEAAAKGGHVIFTSTQTPGLIPNVFAFTSEVVRERPADVQAFVAAWFEAVDWMNAHPDQTPAVVAQATGLKPDDIWMGGGDHVLTAAQSRAAMTPGNDYRSLYFAGREYVQFLAEDGSLNEAPDFNALIDPAFLK